MAIGALTSTTQKTATAAVAAAKAAQNTGLKASVAMELKDPLGMLGTAMTIFQRIKSDAVPVFKEQGVIKGIGATAKAVLAGCANFFSDVGLSVLLRKAIGLLLPEGKIAGALLIAGNIIVGNLSCKLIDKFFPTKMYDNLGMTENNTQNAQNTETTQSAQQYSDTLELSTSASNNTQDSASYIPSSTQTYSKTNPINTKNPYKRNIAYITNDGVVIYEKPDFSIHKNVSENGGLQKAGLRGRLA